MGDTETQSVLGRIAASGREERDARAMTLQKALRITMAKVADAALNLPMAVIGTLVQEVEGEEIEAALDDAALMLLLDGPAGCVGAAVMDTALVGALIQQQTIGTVLPDTGPNRRMTRTDAAICAPLIDMLVARCAPILDSARDCALIEGFEFGAKAEDARTLAIALDAADYIAIALTVDIARGVRQGEIKLILPSLRSRERMNPQPTTDQTEQEGTRKADLTKQVMGLNADLRMIVCTLSVPLNKLRALKVGDDLALPPGAFPNVQITTSTGRILGRGVVGHVDGVRAVKPSRPPLHAERPLRRASDQRDVDVPEVEVLTSNGRSMTVPRAVDVTDAELEAAMQTLSAVDVNMDTTEIPDMSVKPENTADANGPEHATTLVDLPDLEDLPDLDDLPDLADLAMQSVG